MSSKIKPVFKGEDDSEWPSAEEAKRHNECLASITAYNMARERFERAMVNKLKTADGILFDVTLWKDYYLVCRGYRQMPTVTAVAFDRSTAWRLEGHNNEELRIVVRDQQRKDFVTYAVSDLYWHRSSADQRQLELLIEFRGDVEAEIAKLEGKADPR